MQKTAILLQCVITTSHRHAEDCNTTTVCHYDITPQCRRLHSVSLRHHTTMQKTAILPQCVITTSHRHAEDCNTTTVCHYDITPPCRRLQYYYSVDMQSCLTPVRSLHCLSCSYVNSKKLLRSVRSFLAFPFVILSQPSG